MLCIPSEELVRALAGKRHGHVLRSELRQHVEAECREVRHRLVETPDELVEANASSVTDSSSSWWAHPNCRAISLASGSSFDSSSRKPTENVSTGWVISSAMSATIRLESSLPDSIAPERHVAHEAVAHRRAQELEQLLGVFLQRPCVRVWDRSWVFPVRLLVDAPVLHDKRGAGRQLPNVAKRRAWAGHEAKAQVKVERFVVEVERNEPAREHALQLRREDHEVAGAGPVEGFTPSRSRASTARRRVLSQTAMPNFPRSATGKRWPSRS